MGVVSQELGGATGDRMEKLKARHDDLSKEASILERLQKNTVYYLVKSGPHEHAAGSFENCQGR